MRWTSFGALALALGARGCGGGEQAVDEDTSAGSTSSPSCIPESDADFCERHAVECGDASGIDNCGQPRQVTSCGTCTTPPPPPITKLRAKEVTRYHDLFRTFQPTSAPGIGVLTFGGARYLMTLNTADKTDTVQIFDADSGALIFKGSTPANASGNFTHDGEGNLYFSSGRALMTVSIPEKSIREYGTAPAGISGLYDFRFDHQGRLWAGTYPAGVVVCLDPATGDELARTPPLGTGNDYVRSIDISADGRTLWAGTGTEDPDLFRIDVDDPASPTRVAIPNNGTPAFVLRLDASGRKVFVWHDDAEGVETVSVYDTVSGTWAPTPTRIAGRHISQPDASGFVYVNSGGTITRMNPNEATMTAEPVAMIDDRYTWHTGLIDSTLYVISVGGSRIAANTLDIDGTLGPVVEYDVVRTVLPVQSMIIDPVTDTAYAGGYRGDGLCSTDLTTGAWAHSAPEAGIAQIEGMIADQGTLYVGSYGSAIIVEHEIGSGVEDGASFRRLARLGESHQQSRPFAWAATSSHVVFGTVPEYGYRGGALGTIDRSTGHVSVYNRIIPELSIIGLTSDGEQIYGSTSVRAGYGIDDYGGDAVVFAADPRTGEIAWQSAVPGEGELYGPVLLDDDLYVGTLGAIIEIERTDGSVVQRFELATRSGRPGWKNVEVAQIPGTDRIAHIAGGTLSVLDPRTGESATVLTGCQPHLSFDSTGAPWVVIENDLVKLRFEHALDR